MKLLNNISPSYFSVRVKATGCFFGFILSFLWTVSAFGQLKKADTAFSTQLAEVVVTATRTERQLSSLPMPATLVSQKQIRNMGSLRLGDVLQEQTGLAVINDHGQGIQVQGFSPEYTLILVDGEPLIGRTAGTLELSRVAIGNIKQIEIVKGPSSSLYGSEALAGVINIITEKPSGFKGSMKARYGSNSTTDFSGDIAVKKNKMSLYAFANRYAGNGYDLKPEVYGKTVDPFAAYTFTSKFSYDFSDKTQFNISGRYYSEKQDGSFQYGADIINSTGKVIDWNIIPSINHQFTDKLNGLFKFYSSRYKTNSETIYQKNDSLFDKTYFVQSFNRPELLIGYQLNDKQYFTVGAGYIRETVEATRYTEKKKLNTVYGLLNYEFNVTKKIGVIAGARFDKNSVFGEQLSPKLSAKYNIAKWVMLRASAGTGFKSPDFRQLYLNFTNASAGYSVFGTEEVAAGIAKFQSQGQIAEVLIDPASIGTIKAERSVAYNAGATFSFTKQNIKGSINVFHNDITNLIESQGVARKTNGQLVYSYRNISKVFTQGIETDWSYQPFTLLTVSIGYQYLEAKDEAILKNVKSGNVYRRDPVTQVTTRVPQNEYGGLFNRSKHSGNFKIFYENSRYDFNINLRCIYRGRYGFTDKNNNQILDADNEYVKGYTLWNIAATKNLYKNFSVQAGVDNMFNFKNTDYMPGIAGRLWFLSATYSFNKKKQQ